MLNMINIALVSMHAILYIDILGPAFVISGGEGHGPLGPPCSAAYVISNSSMKSDGSGPLRSLYKELRLEQKAQVIRYTMESGNKQAIVRYYKRWGVNLKKSTIRMWKAKYEEKLPKRKFTAIFN